MPNQLEPEEIEGLDQTLGDGWGDYPLDSVFVRNETRSVVDAVRRIEAGRYVLDPEFQRDFVWAEDKQSKLIESCVMRIPLPVFYLAEAPDGKIIVVDGLQRLTTFHRFTTDRFRIRGLSSVERSTPHPLEGRRFSELPLQLQERILDTQLITYILDSKAPERARLDIFERVNSGEPLTRQQMRNALYSGNGTSWLKAAADSERFKNTTGGSLDRLKMRDREAINRFCAFYLLGWGSYRSGDMDGFLASALLKMNDMAEEGLNELRERFNRSMALNYSLFGDHAFRKSLSAGDKYAKRNVLNIALWDVCSVLFAKRAYEISDSQRTLDDVRDAVRHLVKGEQFQKSITYSTNSTQAVSTRFLMAEEAIYGSIR